MITHYRIRRKSPLWYTVAAFTAAGIWAILLAGGIIIWALLSLVLLLF